jgi:type IV pilus assembly protein PilF
MKMRGDSMQGRLIAASRHWTAATCAVLASAWLAAGCTTTTEVTTQPVTGSQPTEQSAEVEAGKRANIRLQLASSYFQKRQFNFAMEETKRALQAEPSNAAAYGLKALIHMELGEISQADSDFAQALRLDSENPELHNNYGWFLCQTKRERESISWFQRAADNRRYATPALAMQNAGLCQMKLRDMKGAEVSLRRSFELDAANPVIKYQLANFYLKAKQVDKAKFYYGLLERSIDATAEIVWLGLRIARLDGDQRMEQQLADDLRRRFAGSPEAAALRRGAFDD